MAVVPLTSETFEPTVTRDGITLVDWWASWCAPCLTFAPVFDTASEQHPDITFVKVDIDGQPQLAAMARIMSVPTLMAFRDGILVYSQPGALASTRLEKVIQQVRALDMTAVRGRLADQHAERTA